MDEIRVHIVAADPLAQAGLAALLRSLPGLRILGPEDAEEADLVLHDLGWEPSPDAPGSRPDGGPPVLFLIPAGAGAQLISRILRDPATRGLLRRDRGENDLRAALEAAFHGLVVLDPAFLPESSPAAGGTAETARPEITPREKDVLLLVAEGLPNKTVAWRLGISEHTVKFHLNSLMAKLGAQSRTEVAVLAMRLGLLPM